MQTEYKLYTIAALTLLATVGISANANAENQAKTTIDLNLRYEAVDQENTLKDASALTLRTRLNHTTASYNGFSGVVEFEDSRQIAGVDDYNDTVGNNAEYSVIADPESTELDQAFVQYKQGKLTAKVGRQVIALDNHRYVGHVGWRQDRQTFDAATINYNALENLNISYSFLNKRNRIFAQANDLHSKDHLINIAYKTQYGQLTTYGYLLEVDEGTTNGLDTFGLSFKGQKDNFSYFAEFSTQDSESGTTDYSATYIALEGGYSFNAVTLKLGAEVLGSDDGMYGFSTPLATLHKFNGWSDQFLATPKEGLVDLYASLSGKAFGGGWTVVVHDFSADEASESVDDLGSEINAVYAKKFANNYTAGIKYSAYSAGDTASGKVDTDKVWVWVSAKF
ncbi:alginate export family protein [Colwellia sp. 4_MG-2023]|uniref:alginate export family protein n=1 Tax=unclassified Colwellia TaxID=196834 RepID=UPI0026E3766C|nr:MULTISPECIES: alginate export family protein [unclassified Colwellia]MDO6505611.1 alginate export family protein [Colwellia sp. 5_MG-2023]MDO6554093.1 alginate export family protein [Colwellia sp. 4_MG-2023]